MYLYSYTHTAYTDIYMHSILQSRVLYHNANTIKEWTINMVLFIAFYFAYNVYCMPVHYINCKDIALICSIQRSQLIQSLSPQLVY